MEEILAQVKTYDIPELRAKLVENGVNVGPISQSSLSLFQRRLAKRLFELQGGKLEEESEEPKKSAIEEPPKEKPRLSSTDSPYKQSDVFYAICLPESVDSNVKEEVGQLVFSDKELALKTAKKVKNSRFKIFNLEKDAYEFTKLTAESAFNSPRKPQTQTQDQKEKSKPLTSESSPYKSPKPQEIVVLRKAIETGNISFFKKCVWDNPRYLVGSGDTPVIYQEGFRYTAMHVAALKNKPEACRVILDTIENPEFVRQLYSQSQQSEAAQNGIINFLVDMYLNVGDRGNCESPLHMACKFGHDNVVEVLIGHPKTDRILKNKYGETPKDIICSRCPNASASLKERIEMLLEGQSYVPLLRSDDNSTTAVIGQPWSPDKNSSLQREERTWSPKDPSMSVKAYAGPMSPSNARNFHKRWTTPPSHSPDQAKKYFDIKRSDCEKGLERIGRQLAHEMKIPWLEYWEFLNTHVDLSCNNGLELLEKYFEKMIWLDYVKSFKDKHCINGNLNDFLTPLKKEKPVQIDNKTDGRTESENNNLPDSADKSTDVVSPMTSLAQKFAKIRLMNESWSDKATVYITDNSNVDDLSEINGDYGDQCDSDKKITDGINIPNEKTTAEKLIGVGLDSANGSSVDGPKESSVDPEDSVDPIKECIKEQAKEGDREPESSVDSANKNSVESIEQSTGNAIKGSKGDDEEDGSANHIIEKDADVSSDCDTNGTKNDELKDKSKEDDANARSVDGVETHSETQDGGELNTQTDKAIKNLIVDENVKDDGEDLPGSKKAGLLKQRSCSSDSTDSFKTTSEDVEDGAEFHDLEETDQKVCINISANCVNQLNNYLKRHNIENDLTNAHFVVRLKSISENSGMKVDIISIPGSDIINCNDLFVLEDVGVSACEGDIGGAEEGDIVEIGSGTSKTDLTDTEAPVMAYLSRSVTLPKVAYLHGPQPTREDLDVSRALGDMIIVPDLYPNVFRWKIRLSRFLKDTNYRWQSPAKVRLQQGSPRPSPLGQTSPVIQYGSPLGLHSQSRTAATSDIRTRLFPSIAE